MGFFLFLNIAVFSVYFSMFYNFDDVVAGRRFFSEILPSTNVYYTFVYTVYSAFLKINFTFPY